MAQKISVFSQLKNSFDSLYRLLNCTDCKRKIDLQAKCVDCESFFCTECLFQIRKTKTCKSCKSTDSIQPVKNRNAFIQELIELIKLFDKDTGNTIHIVKDDFLNVESAENLERIYDKEKTSVFNQQKLFATSTPNINNAKKVVFNTDITMIPQNNKGTNKQIESTEKTNSKKSNLSSSSNNSKRKADSINEKQESPRNTKRARLAASATETKEVENAKENLNEEMELDKQTQPVEKQPQQNSATKKCSSLQKKDQHEDNPEVCKGNNALQEKDLDNRQVDDNLVKQLEEEKNQLKEKIKLLEEKKEFVERSFQLIKEQIKEQMKEQLQELKKLNEERFQEIFVVLAKIVSNCDSPTTSSIHLENVGKINFTIEPFKEVEQPKKIVKDIEIQTDEIKKSFGKFYVQTIEPEIKKFVDANVQYEKMELDVDEQSQKFSNTQENEIRQVVNNVIEECNGVNGDHCNGKLIDRENTANKSNNNFSVQFDESGAKESKEIETRNGKINGDAEDVIKSDEIKKHVDDSIFDSDSDEVLAPSSPIYE